MCRCAFVVFVSTLALGCSQKTVVPPAPAASPVTADPKFDSEWSALAAKGVETLYIEDDRGQGLMGNVRRAAHVPADPTTAPTTTAAADSDRLLPAQPAGEDVQKVIKQNLAAVKTCYLKVSREGTQRSGKAIVSFQIDADGGVAGLKVDAPGFAGTGLPGCVSGQIARWSFPKSQKGGLAVSYPFVFVGG